MKYVVYLDESKSADSRYESIAACSLPAQNWAAVVGELAEIISSSGIAEFKWQKMKTAKYQFAAHKIVDFVLGKLINDLRIDVLVWDNQDSRNSVIGRDSTANYERMFYQLLVSLMNKRPAGSAWGVYPDQRSGVDWQTATDCLNNRGKQQSGQKTLPAMSLMNNPSFQVLKFREANSHEKPLVQVSDLFAGLSVFSVMKFDQYMQWYQENSQQTDMFAVPGQFTHSLGDQVRFSVLREFDQLCKSSSLGVSLRSDRGLRTRDPGNPINFWRYIPQGAYDKAPLRS